LSAAGGSTKKSGFTGSQIVARAARTEAQAAAVARRVEDEAVWALDFIGEPLYSG
jgi:hypothetical protein